VNRAAFTPDGRSVVTVSDDRTARRWDVGTGTVLRGHGGPYPSVTSAEASPDGRWVLTAANDSTARLGNARTGKEILYHRECDLPPSSEMSCLSRASLLNHLGPIEAAAFSPDGRRVATAGAGLGFVMDTVSGRTLATLKGHRRRLFDLDFSPDGTRVVTVGEDDTARVWGARTGSEIAVLRAHRNDVYAATFMPDGRRVVTASADGTVSDLERRRGPTSQDLLAGRRRDPRHRGLPQRTPARGAGGQDRPRVGCRNERARHGCADTTARCSAPRSHPLVTGART
jgi:WD40 repeat protein